MARSKAMRSKLLRVDPGVRLTALDEADLDQRPRHRGDCSQYGRNGARPCPWVGCVHHLYLDVNPESGSIRINFPQFEPWEMSETCALDVADRGGSTLEEVGEIMNLTRERIRQIEVAGLERMSRRHPDAEDD